MDEMNDSMRIKCALMSTTSERIAEILTEKGWTWNTLYKKIKKCIAEQGLNVTPPSRTTVYRWKDGQEPDTEAAKLIAYVCGVSIDSLLNYATAPSTTFDISCLPAACLKALQTTEDTVVMPDGTRKKIISVKGNVVLTEGGAEKE